MLLLILSYICHRCLTMSITFSISYNPTPTTRTRTGLRTQGRSAAAKYTTSKHRSIANAVVWILLSNLCAILGPHPQKKVVLLAKQTHLCVILNTFSSCPPCIKMSYCDHLAYYCFMTHSLPLPHLIMNIDGLISLLNEIKK